MIEPTCVCTQWTIIYRFLCVSLSALTLVYSWLVLLIWTFLHCNKIDQGQVQHTVKMWQSKPNWKGKHSMPQHWLNSIFRPLLDYFGRLEEPG